VSHNGGPELQAGRCWTQIESAIVKLNKELTEKRGAAAHLTGRGRACVRGADKAQA